MKHAKDEMKASAAKTVIKAAAPSYIGCWLNCCTVGCVVHTLDNAEFIIPEEKRPQIKAAVAQYKAL
uniref:Uncharacterized protein n=1 Tax=Prorocentrum minimum TaxID=39449 RepID=A9P6Q9_PROMN|nr:unknown [Prorocentrum minimum]